MQVTLWMRDNPGYRRVDGDENEAVLMWAASERLISLKEFEDSLWYSQTELDQAVMWAEKKEWNGDEKLGR